ncbi:MAG: hypothetical protein QOJ82_3234 [Solirubrobacteraceae bacterium]|jgi:RimJ/RimL family protein N-acetyltransferase|nr:hypothetical protein [Solirubrobacteraceae bacterium]
MIETDHVIEGERVALGPLRRDLAERYRSWIHDLDVRRGVLNPGVYALQAEESWIDESIAKCAGLQPEQASFTIYDRSDDQPVGTCSLFEIGWRFRRATFGILLGERRGQGLGTDATRLALDWGFNLLGLANVLLEVLPENAGAVRAYEKAGFRPIGVRRGSVFNFGRVGDALLMDAVPQEFESPVLRGRGAR